VGAKGQEAATWEFENTSKNAYLRRNIFWKMGELQGGVTLDSI
jgi:hypothetical protein